MARLFLQKTPIEDRQRNEKLPYFRLVLIPENEGDEWVELGAFWVAKSGKGYSGKLNDQVILDVTGVNKNDGQPHYPQSEESED